MKKLWFLLLLAALLFTACAAEEEPAPMVQPVSFYYRTARTDFTAEDGVIRAEVRDLGSNTYSDLALFQAYFEGPTSKELILPAAPDTELEDVRRDSGTLELWLKQNPNSPAELDHALTYACLAKTGLALEGVRTVVLHIRSPGGVHLDDLTLTAADILLYDNGEAPESRELTLYYAEEGGNLLLTEKRQIPLLPAEELPDYAIGLLLGAPESGGMRSPLPAGTAVLDLRVEDGVCTVDFNSDFLHNHPDTEQEEQLAILSVVNTLCELEGINRVQLYSQGRKLERYVYLDLSTPWVLDSSVVGPVREELGEFTGVLCLPDQTDGLLHRVTVRVRARGSASRETALLLALLNRSAQNGLSNPLSGAAAPLSVSTTNRLCTVDLAAGTLPEEAQARETALRSIAATLCSLNAVQSVCISENGTLLTPEPLRPAEDWFYADLNPPAADSSTPDVLK